MSNTFTKTSLRGFTLIELLVVIAIIGLLSTAIMGPVQTGLKKGRDTRKISDISQIQGALLQYAGDNNGEYPLWLAYNAPKMGSGDSLIGFSTSTLASTSPTYMTEDKKMFRSSTEIGARDRYAYVIYADTAGNVVGYHLGVALENQNASLQGDYDCMTQGNGAAATPVANTMVSASWGAMNTTAPVTFGDPKSCVSLTTGSIFNSNAFNTSGGEIGRNTDFPNSNSSEKPGSLARGIDFNGAGARETANDVCTSDLRTCIFDVTPN